MRANFTDCGLRFGANTTEGEALREKWGWTGPIIGIPRNNLSQISRAGCEALCGTNPDYYAWEDASNTITTWILPIVGTLLQAPFESNAFLRTLLSLARWIGSPIASLSYVLWNIKVSAKAALMVDMSVPYGDTPDRKTDFGSMRDSMYLLLVMNQYSMKEATGEHKKEAEGLLRIALFSRDLRLTDTEKSLRKMRRILAGEVREMRRRGAVPVFVSTMWFLFAFALSIQAAFGDFGQNRTAHDLALGCLLAWFPILIMSSIVDRNPIAAEAIMKKLNALLDHVRHSLRDEKHRNDFLDSFKDQREFDTLKDRVEHIVKKIDYMEDFFIGFAGQARIRWHYGAAHAVLSDIESCYIAEKGRNWLADEHAARTSLVLGEVNSDGLVWFDIREFWQVASAVIIVGASCGGAFILSYFTPTVGLGCRSGGYVIFFSISMGLMIMEMIVWLAFSPYKFKSLQRMEEQLQRSATFEHMEYAAHEKWGHLKRRTSRILRATKNACVRALVGAVMAFPWKDKEAVGLRLEIALDKRIKSFAEVSARDMWELFLFRPLEAINTTWLIYIVTAQTFGSYKTCDCVTSNWGGAGGYLDFGVQDISTTRWVAYYWMTGTFLTSMVMGLAMFYITVEWCQQSFLSTENYKDAMRGLSMTRKYRSWTFPLRALSRFIIKYTLDVAGRLLFKIGIIDQPRRTLLWQKAHTFNPAIPHSNDMSDLYIDPRNPAIELSDFCSEPMERDDSQQEHETPAMAHSLFPPAIPRRRPRQDSESSISRPSSSMLHRASHDFSIPTLYERPSFDSNSPLIHRPEEAHPHDFRERVGSRGTILDGDLRRSDEFLGSPATMHEPWMDVNDSRLAGLQIRQGYTRANSDPGSPPTEEGLGLRFNHGNDRDVERGYVHP